MSLFQYVRLFVVDIVQAIDRIAAFPESGRIVFELNHPAVWEIILQSYRVVYRRQKDRVGLLTVYHGARVLDPAKLQ